MENTFIFAFDQDGFETIINLTELDMNAVQAKMLGEKAPQTVGSIVHFLQLRARFNGERRMEVWVLGAVEGITETELWEWANTDPQSLVDILRDRGHNIYGHNKAETRIK